MLLCALLGATLSRPLIFGGDIMLNGVSPKNAPLAALAPIYRRGIGFANLEIPLTRSNQRTARKTAEEIRRRDQYVLKADPAHGPSIRAAGIQIVSYANNHALDFGAEGLRETKKVLGNLPGTGAGENTAEAEKVAKVPGTDIGLLSFLAFKSPSALRKCTPATENSAGVAVLSFGGVVTDDARRKIRSHVWRAKRECKFLVVALHWGIEKQRQPTGYQRDLARAWIDAGADVVWGHHPHVLQPAEKYKGKLILYSMGNLVSPRPGDTALAEWDGVNLTWHNVRIAGGKAKPVGPPAGILEKWSPTRSTPKSSRNTRGT